MIHDPEGSEHRRAHQQAKETAQQTLEKILGSVFEGLTKTSQYAEDRRAVATFLCQELSKMDNTGPGMILGIVQALSSTATAYVYEKSIDWTEGEEATTDQGKAVQAFQKTLNTMLGEVIQRVIVLACHASKLTPDVLIEGDECQCDECKAEREKQQGEEQ